MTSDDERVAFLKTFARVLGYERCGAALEAWNDDPDLAILDVTRWKSSWASKPL